MQSIGLLLISTGKYGQFVEPLLRSINEYFFRDRQINIFLFTDDPSLEWETRKSLLSAGCDRFYYHDIATEHKPFPYPTLYRYKYFIAAKQLIMEQECEYLFYCDVDALFIRPLNISGRHLTSLFAARHCGFANGGWGSNNVHIQSKAFLPEEFRKDYVMGGFQGGSTELYLQACQQLADNIQNDEDRGIMAEWHDESHWNHFLKTHPDWACLYYNAQFFMAEEMEGARDIATMLAIKKDHDAIRY